MQTLTQSKIVCPQCAGENEIPADGKFLECTFCSSAIYFDKSKVVNHFVINSNFNEQQAEGNLRRWMAGNFHVKDLDKNAVISAKNFYYFPLWYFKSDSAHGDVIYLQPATSTSVSEIKSIKIPAGSMKSYNKKDFDEKQFVAPDVLYDSAKSWLEQTGVTPDIVAESNLVHIPFYQFYYTYLGKQYTAMVEASSGMVYANIVAVNRQTGICRTFCRSADPKKQVEKVGGFLRMTLSRTFFSHLHKSAGCNHSCINN